MEYEDGAWWEIETRPNFYDASALLNEDKDLDDALAALTVAWSWDEPVTGQNVHDRQADHMVDALNLWMGDIQGFLDRMIVKFSKSSPSTSSPEGETTPDPVSTTSQKS